MGKRLRAQEQITRATNEENRNMKLQNRSLFLAITAIVGMSACLPKSGDANADKNGDGIADAADVRGVDTVVQQAPTSPSTTIYGVIHQGYAVASAAAPAARQAATAASGSTDALGGVAVTMLTAKGILRTTTTDANGTFAFEGAALGPFTLNVAATGFLHMSDTFYADQTNGVGFPTDNNVENLGDIYLLPAEEGVSLNVTASTRNGLVPPAGTRLTLVTSTYLRLNWGASAEDTPFPAGNLWLDNVTDANGVATFPSMPQFDKLLPFAWGDTFATAYVGSIDTNGDGIVDFVGNSTVFTGSDLAVGRNKVAITPLLPRDAAASSDIAIVGGNLIDIDQPNHNNITPSTIHSTTEAIIIVLNQPADPAHTALSVINAWPQDTSADADPSTPAGPHADRLFTNSTQRWGDEAFPVTAVNASTNAGPMPTLNVSYDPSHTVMTATLSNPLDAGRQYFVVGKIASAIDGAEGNRNFVDLGFTYGFMTAPAKATPEVDRVYVERNTGFTGSAYSQLTFVMNDVVNGDVWVCADEDLNHDGNRGDDNNVIAADRGECITGRALSGADFAANSGYTKLVRREQPGNVGLRAMPTAPAKFWTNFWYTTLGDLGVTGPRDSLKLKVLINPLIDGQINGSGQGNAIVVSSHNVPVPTTVIDVTVAVDPVGASVILSRPPTSGPARLE